MTEQTLKPPPVSRCPKCGFPSGAGESCEACGAILPVVRPYLVSGPPLSGVPPIKREATGGWLAPVLVILVSIGLVLGGLWYYFAPQIASVHQETVITDSIAPPASPAADSGNGTKAAPTPKPAKDEKEAAGDVKPASPVPATSSRGSTAKVVSDSAPESTRAASSQSAPKAARDQVSTDSHSEPAPVLTDAEAAARAQALVASVGRLLKVAASAPARTEAKTEKADRKDSTARTEEASRQANKPAVAASPATALPTPDPSILGIQRSTPDPNAPIVLNESSFTTGRVPTPGNGRTASLLAETRRAIAAWGGGVFVAPTPFPKPSPAAGNGSPRDSGTGASRNGAPSPETTANARRELIEDLTDYTFEAAVKRNGQPVVVDFWAPWCAPCRRFEPVLEEAARTHAGRVRFARVNADENKALVRRYAIEALPTVIVFKSGRVLQRREGTMDSQSFQAWLEKAVR